MSKSESEDIYFLFLAGVGNRLRLTGGPLLSFYNQYSSFCSNKAIFLILKPPCVGCTVLDQQSDQ